MNERGAKKGASAPFFHFRLDARSFSFCFIDDLRQDALRRPSRRAASSALTSFRLIDPISPPLQAKFADTATVLKSASP